VKFLCICAGGNIRSRAMVHALMDIHHQEALSAGAERNNPETFKMLSAWADRIVVMQPQFAAAVPAEHRKKIVICDVGPDVYGSPWHFILHNKVRTFADAWKTRDFAVA
jgi:predicted protein tyrosine phosphatase